MVLYFQKLNRLSDEGLVFKKGMVVGVRGNHCHLLKHQLPLSNNDSFYIQKSNRSGAPPSPKWNKRARTKYLEILSRKRLAYTSVEAKRKKKKKNHESISGRYRCDMQRRKKTGARGTGSGHHKPRDKQNIICLGGWSRGRGWADRFLYNIGCLVKFPSVFRKDYRQKSFNIVFYKSQMRCISRMRKRAVCIPLQQDISMLLLKIRSLALWRYAVLDRKMLTSFFFLNHLGKMKVWRKFIYLTQYNIFDFKRFRSILISRTDWAIIVLDRVPRKTRCCSIAQTRSWAHLVHLGQHRGLKIFSVTMV